MINVRNRNVLISDDERNIGVFGDNDVETRIFELNDMALSDLIFKLDLSNGTDSQIVDLDKTVGNNLLLFWTVKEQHLMAAGEITAQLRAFSLTGEEKWHSIEFTLLVDDSIGAKGYYPSPLPSEFEEMEQRVLTIQTDVIQKAIEVSENTVSVATNTQTAIDKAAEALQSAAEALASAGAAKHSEDNAKGSETSSLEAMQTAVQSMQDLLAMMGSDIATLTNGKLTPSQIPAIAVTDTFVVSTEAAMLTLDAQTGDVCIRTDENKSYILQGADPSALDNWQRLQSPTNYADTAGHAATADEAINATMINNHRVVVMTQAQYDAAVKDADTVYLVGVV